MQDKKKWAHKWPIVLKRYELKDDNYENAEEIRKYEKSSILRMKNIRLENRQYVLGLKTSIILDLALGCKND